MKSSGTRFWLHERSFEDWGDFDLVDKDIDWIMEKEGDETAVLRRCPAPGGGWNWQIICGNYITLSELFHFGKNVLSCFDLYNIYIAMPVWIRRRHHSISHTAQGTKRRNAKAMRHAETGRWGWGR